MASISIRNRIIVGAVFLWSDAVSAKARNAGPEAVGRRGDAPPFKNTRDYVKAIMNRLGQ
jgi:hypothetical protein